MNMIKKLRIFLDDEWQTTDGFDLHIYTAEEAIELIKAGNVSFISLDNDLGEGKIEGQKSTVVHRTSIHSKRNDDTSSRTAVEQFATSLA